MKQRSFTTNRPSSMTQRSANLARLDRLEATRNVSIETVADPLAIEVLGTVMSACLQGIATSENDEEKRHAIGSAFHIVYMLGRLSASN